MGRKQLLYHATTPDCAAMILREGLKRQSKPWVYLSTDPKSWWQPGLVLLKVRITGLKGDMWTFLPDLDEILYEGDINPERISRADHRIPRRYAQMMCRKQRESEQKEVQYGE